MSDRSTSEWVPVSRLIPHPENANRMSKEMRAKLRKNIETTGYYPPIIVRSLEASFAFQPEHERNLLQIIDGEHRWKDAQDAGDADVEVRVWKGINDDQARQLLLTLNRLHGEDDRTKRAQLLREMAEIHSDPAVMAEFLPEDVTAITKLLEEGARVSISEARERARTLSANEAVTFFMLKTQAEAIKNAIGVWLRENDPQEKITDCREGVALEAIARYYMGDDEKS